MPAVVTFDETTMRIVPIDPGSGDISLDVQEIYSEWKEWAKANGWISLPAFRDTGGDPTSATESLDGTYFLLNGWRIRPNERDHRLTLNGNLYTDPSGESPIVPTLGGYTVAVEYNTSATVRVVSAGGGGSSDDIADAVLEELVGDHDSVVGSLAEAIRFMLNIEGGGQEVTDTDGGELVCLDDENADTVARFATYDENDQRTDDVTKIVRRDRIEIPLVQGVTLTFDPFTHESNETFVLTNEVNLVAGLFSNGNRAVIQPYGTADTVVAGREGWCAPTAASGTVRMRMLHTPTVYANAAGLSLYNVGETS